MEPNTPPAGPINYASAEPARQAAASAADNASNLVSSGPGLLQTLQQNLTSIFTKDNPLINAREGALTNYLSTPSATRASLLSSNLPEVAGTHLNLSPTQQNAIVAGREAAALTPLAGLNQSVVGMYGTIPQMVQNAGNIYSSIIQGAQTKAQLAQTNYQQILHEAESQNAAKMQQLQMYLTAGGAQGRATGVLNEVASAARRGLTLKDVMQTFGTNANVSPDDILRTYNTNSIYGPAKENITDLARVYGVTPSSFGMTADQISRLAAVKPALNAINSIQQNGYNMAGPQNNLSKFSVEHLGGAGVSPEIINLNSQFSIIKQEILRAFQGGRISDNDYKQAQAYVPDITDTPKTIETKLRNLQTILGNGGADNFSAPSSNSNSQWEIVK